MRTRSLTMGIVTVLVASTAHLDAGINLGMKLACQDFGNAWNQGSRSAIAPHTGAALNAQLSRLSADEFTSLVNKSRVNSSTVVSSSKSGGHGLVLVKTDKGMKQFILSGSGFNWRVVDVLSVGTQRNWNSLRDVVAATCTVRDFRTQLVRHDQPLPVALTSEELTLAFASVTEEERIRSRKALATNRTNRDVICNIHGNTATVKVDFAANEFATFMLMRRQNGWVVDDLQVQMKSLEMASLKSSYSSYCALVSLAQAIKKPATVQSFEFLDNETLHGVLVKQTSPLVTKPVKGGAAAPQNRLVIADNGLAATCFHHEGHQITVTLASDAQKNRHRITEVMFTNERGTVPLAQRLLWKQRMDMVAGATREFLQWPGQLVTLDQADE